MDAGINNVIYTELHSGPKMANVTCRKTIVAGTIDRGSTVFPCQYVLVLLIHTLSIQNFFLNSTILLVL